MSLHCAGMCGPLVCTRLGSRARMFSASILRYNAGRFVSYCSVGALLALIGNTLKTQIMFDGKVISILLATLLGIQGVALLSRQKWFRIKIRTPQFMTKLVNNLQRTPPALQDFTLGLVTVFLPCMTLTPAFVAAANATTSWEGAGIMLAFYLGTIPVMISVPALAGATFRHLNIVILEQISGLFLVIAAVITLLRIWH